MSNGALESNNASILIGESAPMRQLRPRIARIARSDIAVLRQGPTGSGKTELFLFLTPRVIRDEDTERLTDPLRERLGRIEQ